MALATLNQLKYHLGIAVSDTSMDNRLNLWLSSAISAVINYCGTSFEQATRTEYYSPDGYTFVLINRPVISVTSVYEDPNAYWNQATSPFPASTLLVAGTDYALQLDSRETSMGYTSRSGILRRLNVPWARRNASFAWPNTGWQNQRLSGPDLPAIGPVKVTYVSGYPTIPAAITQAVLWEVDAYKQRAGHGGASLSHEKLGEYDYQLEASKATAIDGLLSDGARGLLGPFRALGNGIAL